MHLAIELPWSDNGWCGKTCDDPEANSHCRAWKDVRSSIDVVLEKHIHGEHWKLTKPHPTSKRNYRLPCWSYVNTFGSNEVPFYPEVHANIYTRRKNLRFKFQRVRNAFLPPRSTACAPSIHVLYPGNKRGTKPLDPLDEAQRLQEFWAQFHSDRDLVFFYCRRGHPLDSEVPVLPVAVCQLHNINKIADGWHPSSRAKYPIWEHVVTHGFPSAGYRIPWQQLIRRLPFGDLTSMLRYPSGVAPLRHPVAAMSSVELLPWIETVRGVALQLPTDAESGSVDWLRSMHESVRGEREAYPSLGAVLDALEVPQPYELAVRAEQASHNGSDDPWEIVLNQVPALSTECSYMAQLKEACHVGVSQERRRIALGVLLSQMVLSNDQVCALMCTDDNLTDRVARISQNPYWLCDTKAARGWGLSEPVAPACIDVLRDDRAKKRASPAWDNLASASLLGQEFARLNRAAKQGDACLPLQDEPKASDLRALLSSQENAALTMLPKTQQRPEFIALANEYNIEVELAEALVKLAGSEMNVRDRHGSFLQYIVVQDQRLPARGLAVIRGAAGTGKSYAIKEVSAQLSRFRLRVRVVTPTGRAAKVLKDEGVRASTLHSLLARYGWNQDGVFSADGRPIRTGCLIIDEASMLSNDQLLTLLRATVPGGLRFLCLVGDPAQLEPIDVGRPFIEVVDWLSVHRKDQVVQTKRVKPGRLGASNLIAFVLRDPEGSEDLEKRRSEDLEELRKGLRSPEPIIQLDDTIELRRWRNSDELREFLLEALLYEASRADMSKYASPLNLAESPPLSNDLLWPKDRKLHGNQPSIYSWQILCPRRSGEGGTESLNVLAQSLIFSRRHFDRRETPNSFACLGRVNRGDKVMWTANGRLHRFFHGGVSLPKAAVVNGALGIVRSPRGVSDAKQVLVQSDDCFSGFAAVPRAELYDYLELGYATTVHKAQGSGFHTVILVLDSEESHIDKRMLYTAVTRHKSKLFVLLGVPGDGSNNAGALAPLIRGEALKDRTRYTMLGELLESQDEASHRKG
ncbi:MAG: ATP-dependent RecD-like DNA helicase [Planctomycetes bacterium]|nr:ATP-dependent RecD-like DNA helicase [Planctomycetota bacterium]